MSELEDQLARKILVLLGHCEQFDSSFDVAWIAEIATDVRVLVHDTDRSRSLLGQLQHLGRGSRTLHFLDTTGTGRGGVQTRAREGTLPDGFPLCSLRLGPRGRNHVSYVARSDGDQSRFVSFDEWWTKPIVRLTTGETKSRKWLINTVANKDGGAHVDLEGRPAAYLRLIRGGETGARFSVTDDGLTSVSFQVDNETGLPIPGDPNINAIPGCIRQIGHEVLRTLTAPYPDFVNYEPPADDKRPYPGETNQAGHVPQVGVTVHHPYQLLAGSLQQHLLA